MFWLFLISSALASIVTDAEERRDRLAIQMVAIHSNAQKALDDNNTSRFNAQIQQAASLGRAWIRNYGQECLGNADDLEGYLQQMLAEHAAGNNSMALASLYGAQPALSGECVPEGSKRRGVIGNDLLTIIKDEPYKYRDWHIERIGDQHRYVEAVVIVSTHGRVRVVYSWERDCRNPRNSKSTVFAHQIIVHGNPGYYACIGTEDGLRTGVISVE